LRQEAAFLPREKKRQREYRVQSILQFHDEERASSIGKKAKRGDGGGTETEFSQHANIAPQNWQPSVFPPG